jgi:hypothetical protein
VAQFDAWLLPFSIIRIAATCQQHRGVSWRFPVDGASRTFKLARRPAGVCWWGRPPRRRWRDFFILADFNFSQTDIGFDNPFRALIGTVRSGWNGKVLDIPLRLGGGSLWEPRHCEGCGCGCGLGHVLGRSGALHPLNASSAETSRCSGAGKLFKYNASTSQIVAADCRFVSEPRKSSRTRVSNFAGASNIRGLRVRCGTLSGRIDRWKRLDSLDEYATSSRDSSKLSRRTTNEADDACSTRCSR